MTADEIRAAIAADPALQAIVPDTQSIADTLSAGRTKVVPRMTSARGLAELLPGGPLQAEMILLKLEATRDALLASADPGEKLMGSMLRRQLDFLERDGLDFGSAALRGMIDQLAAQGVLTAGEVTAIKTIGVVSDPVDEYAVRVAIYNDDGSLRV